MKKVLLISVLIVFLIQFVKSQDYPYDIYHYNFVRYDKNEMHFYNDSSSFNKLFTSIDNLILKGEGQIKVVQLGASHTQADIFSGQVRKRLQTFFPGLKSGRGYVFPFRMIRTNNPSNYYTRHTGDWDVCRNVEWRKTCNLGVTGIAATTYSNGATVSVYLRNDRYLDYDFNKVKILHDTDSSSFDIIPVNDGVDYKIEKNDSAGYTIIKFNKYLKELHLKFEKTDTLQNHFTLYGISLETNDPGFIYHAIGINGASTSSYLRCNMLSSQLAAFKPDWVIIAIGTNDAYTSKFKPELYHSNYDELLRNIKKGAPDAAITLIVPNDSYLYRRRPNKGTEKMQNELIKLAKKHNCSLWSMFDVMGGFNSSVLWYKAGLMARDKVHFSVPGYQLLGNLFFNSFLKSYDNHIEKNNQKLTNYN